MQAVREALALADEPYVIARGLIELFADNAIARAASADVTGSNVVINNATIESPLQTAASTRAAIEAMFQAEGYTPRRDLNNGVSFIVANSADISVQVETSAAATAVDMVQIHTPYYSLTFPPNFIENNVAQTPLAVTVTTGNSYTVNFSRPVDEAVRLSVPPQSTMFTPPVILTLSPRA